MCDVAPAQALLQELFLFPNKTKRCPRANRAAATKPTARAGEHL